MIILSLNLIQMLLLPIPGLAGLKPILSLIILV